MRDSCRRLPTVHEWPAEFGPYASEYHPHSGKHRVSTQADQEPKPLLVSKIAEEKKTRSTTKKRSAIPKRRSISTIRDFPPILEKFNPYLSDERKRVLHTQLT
jgi:hypothetical protein